MVPQVLAGIHGLANLDLPNQLLRGRDLIGKRWALPLGDLRRVKSERSAGLRRLRAALTRHHAKRHFAIPSEAQLARPARGCRGPARPGRGCRARRTSADGNR